MVLTSKRLILYFNPRSHERSDCYSNISLTFSSYFNPRSHERSDGQSGHVYQKNHQISIHAPTRGATCHISKRGIYYVLFQSTLPREERPTQPIIPMIHNNFNPRSHERSDTTCDRLARGSYDFNPRSHERSDCSLWK